MRVVADLKVKHRLQRRSLERKERLMRVDLKLNTKVDVLSCITTTSLKMKETRDM